MTRKSICLIDDDPAELTRFHAALEKWFLVGAGLTIRDALKDLQERGGRRPALFLIDLYHPEGAGPTPEQRSELHAARRRFLDAHMQFRALLSKHGQTTIGGINLALDLPRGAPFAFFTRKGTLDDLVDTYDSLAVALIKKPDPGTQFGSNLDDAYDRAARDGAARIANEIERAIRQASWAKKHALALGRLEGIAIGVVASLIAAGIAWRFDFFPPRQTAPRPAPAAKAH